MYLPRNLLSHLYQQLSRASHALSPPVLVLVALEPDALCACRILTSLLKRDFIPHKIQPVSGYGDLRRAWRELVLPMRTTAGGEGGVVVCLGLGGVDDVEADFFSEAETRVGADGEEVLEPRFDGYGGVECWVVDARRPWNLENMFDGAQSTEGTSARRTGLDRGRVTQGYRPGVGGIICFDDGDIEQELEPEREAHAWMAENMAGEGREVIERIQTMSDEQIRQWAEEHELDEDENDPDAIPDSAQYGSKKRKSWGFDDDDEDDDQSDVGRPAQRRRSNSSSPIPSSPRQAPRGRGLISEGQRLGGSSDVSRSPSPAEGSASPAPRRRRRQTALKDGDDATWQLFIKYRKVLRDYEALGSSFSEPISSMMYSLASDLGREDNDLLWYAIVGVSSMELSGRTMTGVGLTPVSTAGGAAGWNGERGDRIRAVLRDEVRRLNPAPTAADIYSTVDHGIIQTHAKSPNDNAIRLSPEPRFLLIRHWSLYDSMLHSPYLSAKLHIWSDAGRRRLHKLLAKMGVSLAQCRQSYTHMDMDLKRSLREKLLKFAPQYSLEGLVPPTTAGKEGWGFVRCWGWKACLSAADVGVVVGAVLDVGDAESSKSASAAGAAPQQQTYSQRVMRGAAGAEEEAEADALDAARADSRNERFWAAYDALGAVSRLSAHVATAQYLHRAILRTGASLIEKRQIRHLKAFRMAVVREGPDVALFAHPGALVKLALWVAEAVVEMEGGRRLSAAGGRGSDLVMAGLDEARGSYVVVGLGGGGAVALDKERQKRREEKMKRKEQRREEKRRTKELEREKRRERMVANGDDYDSDDYEESEVETSDDDEDDADDSGDEGEGAPKPRGFGRNKFGAAFQQVMDETGCRVRQDSFDHCVVDVKKEDLTAFLERLSETMIEMMRVERAAELKAQRAAEVAKAAAAAASAGQERARKIRRASSAVSDDLDL